MERWSPCGHQERCSTLAPVKLTNPTVTALQTRNRRYIVWDTVLKGFGCRIETSGTKSFLVRYRAAGGGRNAPKRFYTIGRFPTLSTDDARREARKILAGAIRGEDPAGARTAARQDMTVAELCDRKKDTNKLPSNIEKLP